MCSNNRRFGLSSVIFVWFSFLSMLGFFPFLHIHISYYCCFTNYSRCSFNVFLEGFFPCSFIVYTLEAGKVSFEQQVKHIYLIFIKVAQLAVGLSCVSVFTE